jgi:thiosulfate/3-mercaptopyruvate sulfurtransferase
MMERHIKMSRSYFALAFIIAAMVLTGALTESSSAICPPSGCGGSGGNWEASAQAFLNSDVPLVGTNPIDQVKDTSFKAGRATENERSEDGNGDVINAPKAQTDYVPAAYRSDLFIRGELLKSMPAVSSSDLVLDVSNSYAPGDAHIRGAIHIPSKSFLYENGTLRSVSEIAEIFGDAGISGDDSIVVYSDSFPSGEATFVFWLLCYLGHEDVKALDGGLDDWTKASLPLETEQNSRNTTNYTPALKSELLASYEYVKSGTPQTVDARTFEEFGKGRIPQAFFIGTGSILGGGKVRTGDQLNDTFAKLKSDRQTVVYSTDLLNSSLVWYALQLMGFNSGIYSWQDWQEHRQEEVYEIG